VSNARSPATSLARDATAAYAAWTGGKRYQVETRGDGVAIVALVLYRPD
jgi:hypothetical protein